MVHPNDALAAATAVVRSLRFHDLALGTHHGHAEFLVAHRLEPETSER